MATCDLMKKIFEVSDADCDQNYVHVCVDCNTNIPDRTKAILENGEDPIPEMVKSAVSLQNMGADLLMIPCNTAHFFYDRLKIFTDISPYIQYGNTDIPPDLLSSFMFAFFIILLVTVVVTVIQSIFTNLGVARMAANNSFSDGLDFFEVFNDIGKIGWFKTVGWFIVICVLNMVFFMISMGIMMIPYVGVILAAFFMMTFMKLFNSYSVGLLYSDAYKISKTQEDIKEIPKAENISERRDVLDEYEEISKDKKEDTIDSMYGEKDE